jgi:aspartate/methionine/tyrosine aminotransferase
VSTPVALAVPRLSSSAADLQHTIAERCRANLEILRRAAADHPAVSVPRVGGGWSVVVRLPAILDDEELALRLLTQRGVAVQPGFFFDLPYDGALVLSLLTPENVWRRGLDAICDTVETLI